MICCLKILKIAHTETYYMNINHEMYEQVLVIIHTNFPYCLLAVMLRLCVALSLQSKLIVSMLIKNTFPQKHYTKKCSLFRFISKFNSLFWLKTLASALQYITK